MNPKQILNNYRLGSMPGSMYRRGGSKGRKLPMAQFMVGDQAMNPSEGMGQGQTMLEQQTRPDQMEIANSVLAMANELVKQGNYRDTRKGRQRAFDEAQIAHGLVTPNQKSNFLDYFNAVTGLLSPIATTYSTIANTKQGQQSSGSNTTGGFVRKHGGLLKAQTTGEQILRDTLPGSFLKTSLGQDLLDVNANTANRIRNIYERAQDIDDVSSGIDFFRSVDKKDIKDVMRETGITKDEVRDYIYDQDFYEDAGFGTRQAIKLALRLKGLKHGGAQRYQTKGAVSNPSDKKVIMGMMTELIKKTGMDQRSAQQIMGALSELDATEAMQYLQRINQDVESTRTEKRLLSPDMKRRGGAKKKRKAKYQNKGEFMPKPIPTIENPMKAKSGMGVPSATQRRNQMKHGGSMCRGLPGGPNEFIR
tara:strand:+ start:1388 stop:2647 length:1260 start_codon:yes stop_codon:yes gene_type:complete